MENTPPPPSVLHQPKKPGANRVNETVLIRNTKEKAYFISERLPLPMVAKLLSLRTSMASP